MTPSVNLGLFQPDLNVLWDLGPHDFSIMDYRFDEDPLHVEATGYCHVNPHLPDIAYVTVHFASNTIAHFNLSWMSPVKVCRIAIGRPAGSHRDDGRYGEFGACNGTRIFPAMLRHNGRRSVAGRHSTLRDASASLAG